MNTSLRYLSLMTATVLTLASCGTVGQLVTNAVAYQSVHSTRHCIEIPDDATVAVGYSITDNGEIIAVVRNLTDEILIIDQTKSFFVNSDGLSTSYYDPTVHTTSTTSINSETAGASVNLGAIGSALGIGGPIGSLLSGVNVGGSNTVGASTSNTIYFADQPQIALAPKSHGAMSKNFQIKGIGKNSLNISNPTNMIYTPQNSPCKFSVCISYSVDGGATFEKLVTDFYLNALIVSPVAQHGKVNDALRAIYADKPDAINEPWWMVHAVNNYLQDNGVAQGIIIDFQ